MEKKELFYERTLTGRKGKGAIDSVMRVDERRRKTGGDVCGRDIIYAFNSLDRDFMYKMLQDPQGLGGSVDYVLCPRTWNGKAEGSVVESITKVGRTPQGSRISPTL